MRNNEHLDLFSAAKGLKKKYELYYDEESRIKQINFSLNGKNLNVFSTGNIIIRSRDIVKQTGDLRQLKKDLMKFVFKK